MKIEIYTLTGPAGTGKSYQAMDLCSKYNIDGLLDDGLFIYKNRVEAGISAKRQKTKVGAIKTALFTDDQHRDRVVRRIHAVRPKKLLVIGTSDRMADKILARLELPPAQHRIHIEDITTEEERKAAERQRTVQGKHIIPVPTLQLKRDFAGYFLDPLRIIRTTTGFLGGEHRSEKTVVRPTYSYMGEFYISDLVINDIANCLAEESDGIHKVLKVYENTSPDELCITISLALNRGCELWNEAEEFQTALRQMVEYMTAFNVVKVDVEVRQIV
ncbi:MAG: hypothetical protein ACOYJJ_06975 [Anaerovoracaceae bacterium]|jgi:uncharacterized alkaline shock family protein YloU